MHSRWDRACSTPGTGAQAASEMSELQTALSEGELTLANSACWLFFSLNRKVCEKQKGLFLLLCFGGVVLMLLLIVIFKCKKLAFFFSHCCARAAVEGTGRACHVSELS